MKKGKKREKKKEGCFFKKRKKGKKKKISSTRRGRNEASDRTGRDASAHAHAANATEEFVGQGWVVVSHGQVG